MTMNREEFTAYAADLIHESIRIMDNKGNDYSGNEDVHSNFKKHAEKLDLTPEQVWAVYFDKHIDAIMTYVKDGKVESEGIEGRIVDAINYLILFGAMVRDKNGTSNGTGLGVE